MMFCSTTRACLGILLVDIISGQKHEFRGRSSRSTSSSGTDCRVLWSTNMASWFQGNVIEWTYIYILSRHPGTMTVWFKVLGSRCHWSMYYCCCIPEIHVFVPKLCRPIIYQDKHDRLSKTATLLSSRTAPKIYEYSNSWTICPRKLWRTLF